MFRKKQNDSEYQKRRLEKGVKDTLKQLLDTQRAHGTDDYNEYVYNVIEPLIHLHMLPTEWEEVYNRYKEIAREDFDYGELGDWLLTL